jgi:hypothetical protein
MRAVSLVSGVIARSVFTVTLKERPDPREQIRRATESIRPGRWVLVQVKGIRPVPFGMLGFISTADFDWMRPNLKFQFESSVDDEIAQEWENLANFLNSCRGGSK